MAAVDTALVISLGIDLGNINSPAPEVREPTEEELAKYMHDKLGQSKIELVTPEPDAQLIRLETERDLYRKLYGELLENITKGARI